MSEPSNPLSDPASLLLFPISIVRSIFDANVIHDVWWWFVVPAFHAPAIDIKAAWGLLLLVAIAVFQPRKDITFKEGIERQVNIAFALLQFWGTGYAVAHWL